jgi:acetyl esterase/lipase
MSYKLLLIICALPFCPEAVAIQQNNAGESSNVASKAFPPPANLRIVRDLIYARYGERQLRLDLYLPPQKSKRPIPGIVVVRGGGWRQGDKEGFAFIAGYLAKSGFAAVCIEYRTSGEARFPAAVHDTKAAVRWLRANASRYGVDPQEIGAIGGSAGGHLVALLGTSHYEKELEGAGGNADASSRVQAVVAMAPVTDFRTVSLDRSAEAFIGRPLQEQAEEWKAASPIVYVNQESAPILLIHSRIDKTVPHEQSVILQARYKEVGRPAELVTIADAAHAFWNSTRWFQEYMEQSVGFFRRTLQKAKR